MPLPTDYVDGDVLSASDVNAITTAVNAIDVDAAIDAVKLVVTNAQTANYTLVLADGYKAIEMNVASANTLTVPDNDTVAFPVGTQIIVIQTGAGATTLAGAAGVTVNSKDTNLELGGQYAGVTLIKRATDTWIAVGDLA